MISSSTGNKQFPLRKSGREPTSGGQRISCRVQAHTAAPPIMGIFKRKRVNRDYLKKEKW
jgi:hypothetical protein